MLKETERSQIIALRKQIIEREFSDLNDMQRRAALTVKGPLLVIAGAGSGKTTVLVNRTAHILRWGEAYESTELFGSYSDEETAQIQAAAEGRQKLSDELAERLSVSRVYPWRILAITFTNKAAGELKERICARVGSQGEDIWAATFHAVCTRILRRYGDRLGYTAHFAIYDTDDQKKMIKECFRQLGIDEKMLAVKEVLYEISHAKDHMVNTTDYLRNAGSDVRLLSIARVYQLYHEKMFKADAMDFDDIIFNTVTLFRSYPDVLEKYAEQFRYIMVDEYQDTNMIQYELVRLLAEKHRNICVVGDDDQSIYKFRGAMAENILDFDLNYSDAKVIKLEQNYRSTKTILAAANSVIRNNAHRRDKTLWTDNEQGEKIVHYTSPNESSESEFIIDEITSGVSDGGRYSDYAVLYRMNSQSQSIERAMVKQGIPYRIIGGHRFYEHKEIRDMMAYLNLIANRHDNARLKRIINVPKRGIGDKTVNQIEEIGYTLGMSMFEVMQQSEAYQVLSKISDKLRAFCRMIDDLEAMLADSSIADMYEKLIKVTDYEAYLAKSSDRTDSATENIHELTSSIARYEQEAGENADLQGFLEETALMTDIDAYQGDEDKVVLMTLHSAKGLEFPVVFIPGMEENIFPGYQSTQSEEDMQEERRLAYVGITRAKKRLFLINSESRMLFGRTSRNRPSRFIGELPEDIVEHKKKEYVIDPNAPVIPDYKTVRRQDIANSRIISGSAAAKPRTAYAVGMRVRHKTFGEGMILSVKPMAADSMLEIAFDTVGTKKMMASFAPLMPIF